MVDPEKSEGDVQETSEQKEVSDALKKMAETTGEVKPKNQEFSPDEIAAQKEDELLQDPEQLEKWCAGCNFVELRTKKERLEKQGKKFEGIIRYIEDVLDKRRDHHGMPETRKINR